MSARSRGGTTESGDRCGYSDIAERRECVLGKTGGEVRLGTHVVLDVGGSGEDDGGSPEVRSRERPEDVTSTGHVVCLSRQS